MFMQWEVWTNDLFSGSSLAVYVILVGYAFSFLPLLQARPAGPPKNFQGMLKGLL